MNKNNLLNIILLVAVGILYVLHFTGNSSTEQEQSIEDATVLETAAMDQDPTEEPLDSGVVAAKPASASKVAYFNLENLVASCSYLKLKTEALIDKERRLYQSFDAKEKEFQKWYADKQAELAEYDKKKMLVQSHLDQAQREGAEKQQALQIQIEKEKQVLMQEKQKFGLEREEIIYEAIQTLNANAGWDYVLVDNSELRLVIPFNEENNVTENLAGIINKRFVK